MKTPQDISKDPDMIELERMIEAGELDGDRVKGYTIEKSQQSSEEHRKEKELPKQYPGQGG